MRQRPGRHAKGYTKIDFKANEELAKVYCINTGSCHCQVCLSGAHSDGKTLTHCYIHDSGCHLGCE